jgi:hypothetical protein
MLPMGAISPDGEGRATIPKALRLSRNGWTPLERRSYITDVAAIDGERFRQAVQAYAQGKIPPPSPDDFSGVHLLGRA